MLAVSGLAIAATATKTKDDNEDHAIDWRGWSCIIGGTLAFAVLGMYGGLVIASFAIVFISAMGDRNNTVLQAAALAAAMVVVSITNEVTEINRVTVDITSKPPGTIEWE